MPTAPASEAVVGSETDAHRARSAYARPPSRRSSPAARLLAPIGVVLVLYGIFIRAWILTHSGLTSDEATVGAMGRQILHGHFYTFYWGQQYGGVEPYAVAAMQWLFGTGAIVVNATPAVLYVFVSVAVWRLGSRLFPASRIGVAAGLLIWVWPEATLWLSTREMGFREATVLCGLIGLIAVHEVVWGRRRIRDWAILGLALGIGFWASPEIAYYLTGCGAGLLLGLADRGFRASAFSLRGLPVAAGTFLVGSLPWIYTNIQTGFASVNVDSHPITYGASTYPDRVRIFFEKVLPILLGLRVEGDAHWVFGHAISAALYVLALVGIVVSIAWVAARRPPLRPVAAVVCCYPFVYAAFATGVFWNDARYGSLITPALGLVLVGGVATVGRRPAGARRPRHRSGQRMTAPSARVVVCCGLGVLAVASTLQSFSHLYRQPLSPTGWIGSSFKGGFEDPSLRTIAALERDGVRFAFAQYWIAYDFDYLSDGRLVLSPPDEVRWHANFEAIAGSHHPSWLFLNPAVAGEAYNQFGSAGLGMPASTFENILRAKKMGFRQMSAGLVIVVTPDGDVEPRDIGFTPIFSNVP